MFVKPSFFLNLPGWRWGSITQNPLVAVSRPLHSGVCETRQDIGLPVLHSEISDSGLLRTRGDQQEKASLRYERASRVGPCVAFSPRGFVMSSRCCYVLCACACVCMCSCVCCVLKRSRLCSSWGTCWCTLSSVHRSHFGSRYQSGRCALRSPFMQPRSFDPSTSHSLGSLLLSQVAFTLHLLHRAFLLCRVFKVRAAFFNPDFQSRFQVRSRLSVW